MPFTLEYPHPQQKKSKKENLTTIINMVCLTDPLVQKVNQLYLKISKLDDLRPSSAVDELFTALVRLCIPPHPIDVTKLCPQIQAMRAKLISLCGAAEGLMEKHYSTTLAAFRRPLDHLHLFPYYSNYLSLSRLEFDLLSLHHPNPRRLAFVGSGPLPLTSIVLAAHHLKSTVFHNFDIDAAANAMAADLIAPHPEISDRMTFHTDDIMNVSGEVIREYDVIFLAALVGMDVERKMLVVEHLANHMAAGAILMLRSAHGARAFLYPVVDTRRLSGFEVLSIYHPTDEVINSVVVARRSPRPEAVEQGFGPRVLCSKCSDVQPFNINHPMCLVEELAAEEHLC